MTVFVFVINMSNLMLNNLTQLTLSSPAFHFRSVIIFAILLVVQTIIIMSLEGIDSIKYILVLSSIPLILIYALMIFYISKNALKN